MLVLLCLQVYLHEFVIWMDIRHCVLTLIQKQQAEFCHEIWKRNHVTVSVLLMPDIPNNIRPDNKEDALYR